MNMTTRQLREAIAQYELDLLLRVCFDTRPLTAMKAELQRRAAYLHALRRQHGAQRELPI
jgi:hypothetical protein